MIYLTATGKLGDFALGCLPIASWLHKTRGKKIHWLLADAFGPFHYITPLLKLQPFTHDVTLCKFPVKDFGCGGQPYKFNIADYGFSGQCYNLGLRSYPNKSLPHFYAEEYGLGVDDSFTLELGEVTPTNDVMRTEQIQCAMARPSSKTYAIPGDLLDIMRQFKAAKERHCWYSGIASLCYVGRLSQFVYHHQGQDNNKVFFPQWKERGITFVSCII